MADFHGMNSDGQMPALTTVIAWSTTATVHARQVPTGGDVSARLREIATKADAVVDQGGGGNYDPDDMQDPEVPFLRVAREDLLDPALETELRKGASLDVATTNELLKRPIRCHGVLIGDAPESQSLYIRRYSPVQVAKKSIVTRLLGGALEEIDEPILAFDDRIDVLFRPDGVFLFEQKAFEALFSDTDAVIQNVPDWAQALASSIPLRGESLAVLTARGKASSVIRRKLHAINRRGHLQDVTIEEVRTVLADMDLPESEYLAGDEIFISKANERMLLNVLNEDLYRGAFSHARLAASYKSEA